MFYLDDCSSPVEALEAVMAVVREVSEKKPTSCLLYTSDAADE